MIKPLLFSSRLNENRNPPVTLLETRWRRWFVCVQRGRVEEVVVSDFCRGKQLGKLWVDQRELELETFVSFVFLFYRPKLHASFFVLVGWFQLFSFLAKSWIATKSHWNVPPEMWRSTKSLATRHRTTATCSVDSLTEDGHIFRTWDYTVNTTGTNLLYEKYIVNSNQYDVRVRRSLPSEHHLFFFFF